MLSCVWLFATLMDCSLPGSPVLGILQARILQWVAISFSRGSSWPRDRTWVFCFAGRFFTAWATYPYINLQYFFPSVSLRFSFSLWFLEELCHFVILLFESGGKRKGLYMIYFISLSKSLRYLLFLFCVIYLFKLSGFISWYFLHFGFVVVFDMYYPSYFL